MTCRDIARRAWEADCTLSFDRAEMNCLLAGVVISTPSLYVMAMIHPIDATDAELLDVSRHPRRMTSGPQLCHVWLATGKLEELLGLLHGSPEISQISYQKRSYEIIRRHLQRHGKRITTTATSGTATSHDEQR